MIKQLIKLANHLDSKGLRREADCLDSAIQKIAARKFTIDDFMDGPNPAQNPEWHPEDDVLEDAYLNPAQTATEPGLELDFSEEPAEFGSVEMAKGLSNYTTLEALLEGIAMVMPNLSPEEKEQVLIAASEQIVTD